MITEPVKGPVVIADTSTVAAATEPAAQRTANDPTDRQAQTQNRDRGGQITWPNLPAPGG